MRRFLSRFQIPITVLLTVLAMFAALGVIGALLVPRALASGPWLRGQALARGFGLPPGLEGLVDLPPAERFAHFKGAQVTLTDRDNRPLTIQVTPGTATAVSQSSITVAANDGSTKTFALDDQTVLRGRGNRGGVEGQQAVGQGSQVVVVTFNDNTTAHAVVSIPADGFGWRGHGRHGGYCGDD